MSAYTDDDLRAGREALRAIGWEPSGYGPSTERSTRAVLDAVAPAIAARALREAADEWGCGLVGADTWRGRSVAADLRERADGIEGKP